MRLQFNPTVRVTKGSSRKLLYFKNNISYFLLWLNSLEKNNRDMLCNSELAHSFCMNSPVVLFQGCSLQNRSSDVLEKMFLTQTQVASNHA